MSAYKLEMNTYKQKLIDKYLMPKLDNLGNDEVLIARFSGLMKLRNAIKYQILEEPGKIEDGYVWFAVGAMCHSYTYKALTGKVIGTRIYRKQEFVFNDYALAEGADRKEFIEMLEPGEVLYMRYMDLQLLMREFMVLEIAMLAHRNIQGNYFRRHAELLQQPALERVQRLRVEQSEFIRCSSYEIQARHVNMSLRTYYWYMKILNGTAK